MDIRAERGKAPRPREGDRSPDLTSLADVVDRLNAEFESQLNRTAIARTVRRCGRELDTVRGPALPELVERLARQRLHAINDTRTNRAGERSR
jgi:hypothetical protein